MNKDFFHISTGSKVGFYTLRFMEKQCRLNANGEIYYVWVSQYWQNLSTDWDSAVEKAKEFSRQTGFPLVLEGKFDLEEIKRMNAEEAERARNEQYKVSLELDIAWKENYGHDLNDAYDIAKSTDIFLGGNCKGQKFSDVAQIRPDYIKWCVSNCENINNTNYFMSFNIICLRLKEMVENGELVLKESKHNYEPKDKIEIDVICSQRLVVDSLYGSSTMYKFVDADGNVYVTFYSGHGWKLKECERATIKGTVKKNDEFRDVKQTVLTRVKAVSKSEEENEVS
ncbi:hypothetical protein POP12_139 [Pectobacterium phage POP12]|nr:hypothetical protein POP12_139 [Pectobacterium phage POP12]